MIMKNKFLTIISIVILVLTLALSGCYEDKNNQNTNVKITYPLHPNAEETTYKNETIWNIMNVSSELNKTFYVTDTSVSDIVDWYSNKQNIPGYSFLDGGGSIISVEKDIDPNNISYGYVKVHKNNKTEGLFVFIIKGLEEMQLEKENLMGITTGPWNLIDSCGKTGNFTKAK